MKKTNLLLLALVLLCGCSKEETEEQKDNEALVTIRVDVTEKDGDAGEAVSRMTRATPVASSDMTDLWVFDYVGGEMKQNSHQTSTASGFGTVSMVLPLGSHTLYFVASRGDEPDEDTDDIITWGTPKDTFWGKLNLNLTSGTSTSVTAELQRVVTKLAIAVTDAVPSEMAAVVITPATWYYGLNYTTGAAVGAENGRERVIAIPASLAGTTDLAASVCGLSGGTEWTTGFTVSARDDNGNTIGQAAVASAPFKANRTTRFTGPLFHANEGIQVTLADEWLEDVEMTW